MQTNFMAHLKFVAPQSHHRCIVSLWVALAVHTIAFMWLAIALLVLSLTNPWQRSVISVWPQLATQYMATHTLGIATRYPYSHHRWHKPWPSWYQMCQSFCERRVYSITLLHEDIDPRYHSWCDLLHISITTGHFYLLLIIIALSCCLLVLNNLWMDLT